MSRWLAVAGCLLGLSGAGCTAASDSGWWREWAGLSGRPGQYHFDWGIAGDPSVAPAQVFDDGRRTWLQYPADHPAPAIFQRGGQGDVLRRPWREGDYLVIDGVPPRLILRGGLLEARAWRIGAADPTDGVGADDTGDGQPYEGDEMAAAAAVAVGVPRTTVGEALPAAVGEAPPTGRIPPPAAPDSAPAAPGPTPVARAPVPAPAVRSEPAWVGPAVPMAPPAAARASYAVGPDDGTIRQALGRWAAQAGWIFESEHWAVDVDIPIAGAAAFGGTFQPAVRDLLAATELGDRPLQPCFYANRVLRVVPLAGRCDRTQPAAPDAAGAAT